MLSLRRRLLEVLRAQLRSPENAETRELFRLFAASQAWCEDADACAGQCPLSGGARCGDDRERAAPKG